MAGRQMNIYLEESNYSFLKNNIKERKISSYINEAISEKNQREIQIDKEKMIATYKSMANDSSLNEIADNFFNESSKNTSYE